MRSDPSKKRLLVNEMAVYLFLLITLLIIGLVGLFVLGGGA